MIFFIFIVFFCVFWYLPYIHLNNVCCFWFCVCLSFGEKKTMDKVLNFHLLQVIGSFFCVSLFTDCRRVIFTIYKDLLTWGKHKSVFWTIGFKESLNKNWYKPVAFRIEPYSLRIHYFKKHYIMQSTSFSKSFPSGYSFQY